MAVMTNAATAKMEDAGVKMDEVIQANWMLKM